MTDATGGRRELRKARTRAEVRATAQRLFAERGFDEVTIADVAAAADVAVQTVFNHFETKEALFFDGRTPWVEGSAAAVSRRARRATDPVGALRPLPGAADSPYVLRPGDPAGEPRLHRGLEGSAGLQSRDVMLVELAGLRAADELARRSPPAVGRRPGRGPGDGATCSAG